MSRSQIITGKPVYSSCSLAVATTAFSFLLSVAAGFAQTGLGEPPTDASDQGPAISDLGTNQLSAEPITSPAPVPPAPLAGTSQLAPVQAPAGIAAPSSPRSQLRWGPVDFYPHVAYQLSYGNGLQFTPGQQANTLVNQVSPGLRLNLGSHWTLDYTPTFLFYSDSQIKDGVNQLVQLTGTTTYQDWTFGLSQGYSLTTQPLIETASQLNEEDFSTAITAGYQMNSKMSLSLGINQDFRYVGQAVASEGLTDVREWSTMDWLNYQLAPRLAAGVGAGFTYDNLAVGPDMTSEQLQGRITWRAGTKLSFVISGGLNDQQFLASGTPDLLAPIYSLSAQYQLFTTTGLSLTAGRAVVPSFFQNAATESSTLNAALTQRLLEKFFLNVGGGYGTTTFRGTTTGPIGGGNVANYDSTSFNVSLSTILRKRATVSIFYQVTYNSSGSSLYNYTITQEGLTLAYSF